MESITKTTILTCTVVAAILILVASGGGALAGAISGAVMGDGSNGATSWIWIPTLLAVGMLGIAIILHFCEEE